MTQLLLAELERRLGALEADLDASDERIAQRSARIRENIAGVKALVRADVTSFGRSSARKQSAWSVPTWSSFSGSCRPTSSRAAAFVKLDTRTASLPTSRHAVAIKPDNEVVFPVPGGPKMRVSL